MSRTRCRPPPAARSSTCQRPLTPCSNADWPRIRTIAGAPRRSSWPPWTGRSRSRRRRRRASSGGARSPLRRWFRPRRLRDGDSTDEYATAPRPRRAMPARGGDDGRGPTRRPEPRRGRREAALRGAAPAGAGAAGHRRGRRRDRARELQRRRRSLPAGGEHARGDGVARAHGGADGGTDRGADGGTHRGADAGAHGGADRGAHARADAEPRAQRRARPQTRPGAPGRGLQRPPSG